jgi:hypothetical protein
VCYVPAIKSFFTDHASRFVAPLAHSFGIPTLTELHYGLPQQDGGWSDATCQLAKEILQQKQAAHVSLDK